MFSEVFEYKTMQFSLIVRKRLFLVFAVVEDFTILLPQHKNNNTVFQNTVTLIPSSVKWTYLTNNSPTLCIYIHLLKVSPAGSEGSHS